MKSIPFALLVPALLALGAALHAGSSGTDSTIHLQSDGSRIIVERFAGVIEVPDPPEPVVRSEEPPQTSEEIAAAAAQWQAWRETNPFIHAGASVYRLPDGRRLTHVSHWSVNNRPAVSFWSTADFALLAHPGEIVIGDGESERYGLLLMHSIREVESAEEIAAFHNLETEAFPEGPAGWQLDASSALSDAATLAAIEAVHQHYAANLASLKAAYHQIEAERAARRADLEANPPQPRDIHLRVGRLSREQAADWHHHSARRKGGAE